MQRTVGIWLACLAIAANIEAADPCDLAGERQFSLLSNNVGIFPAAVVAQYPAKLREKKQEVIADEEERAGALARSLLAFAGDPDAIVLQEIWSIKARDALIRELKNKYAHCKFPQVDDAAGLPILPSGLMIFSKYPIEAFAFKEFRKGIGLDKLSRKGIAGARLTKEGRKVALFTTHLQAGGKRDPSVKPDQLRECRQFIREFTGGAKDVTVILAGDFNIDCTQAADYAEIFAQLPGARDSHRVGCGTVERSVRPEGNANKRIDYLLTFDGTEAVSKIVDPAGRAVSDHLAVYGTISLDGPK